MKQTFRLVATLMLCMFADGADASPDEPAGLHTERFGAPALALGDAIYVPGGCSNRGILGSLERIDAETGRSERLPCAILPRYFHAGAVHDGKLVLVGGLTPIPGGSCGVALVYTPLVEQVDPADGSLRHLAPLPQPVARNGAAVVGNRLYVVGGSLPGGQRTDAVQIYDFESGEWSQGAKLPVAREGMVIAANGKILAPGGYDGATAIRDFFSYSPAEDRWERLPSLPVKLSAHHGVFAEGRLYTFGDYEILDRTAVFDFESGQWNLVELNYKPSRHQGAALVGDTAFVVGGNVDSSAPYLGDVQRYPLDQLAAAKRLPWTPGAEKAPELPARRSAAAPGCGRGAPSSVGLADFELSGMPAPALEMPLFGGGSFALSNHLGKVVVLDFWSTGCPPCVRALPEMAALAKNYQGQDVVFAGVSLDPPSRKDRVAAFLSERDVPFAMGHGSRQMGREYAVRGIPCIVVVGRDGLVKGRLVGFSPASKAALRRAIDELLLADFPPPVVAPPPAPRPSASEVPAASMRKPPTSPDPRFFQLKWRKPLDSKLESRYPAGHRIDWRMPPAHLVLCDPLRMQVRSAADGTLVHSIEHCAETSGNDEGGGTPSFVYLRDGEQGVLVGGKTIYEVTQRSPCSRSYRSVGVRWMGVSHDGKLLWTRDEKEDQGFGVVVHALPAGPSRDVALASSSKGFQIMDPYGSVLLAHRFGSHSEQWIFRPAPGGTGVEALVAGADLACYEVVVPPAGALDPRRFQKRWTRPAADRQWAADAGLDAFGETIPQPVLVLRNDSRIDVLDPDNGDPVASFDLPFDLPAKWVNDPRTTLAYARDGGVGKLVALRTSDAPGTQSETLITLAGFNRTGGMAWIRHFAAPTSQAELAVLPDGKGRDLLLLRLRDRWAFIAAKGSELCVHPMPPGASQSWRLLPVPGGDTFDLIELGPTLNAYRWKPAPR
jgi:thiol-disulfide isomerase/thioredoxin